MKNPLQTAFLIMVLALNCLEVRAQNSEEISPEALNIHHSGMLFDGHNDLPWTMRTRAGSSFDKVDISQPTNFHTDIPRLKKGGVKAQFWSVYVPAGTDLQGTALVQTLEQIELVHKMCKRYPDVFEMADTADDIERIVKQGKIASMIGVEGGHSIQNSLQALRELYNRGARYMTLTHSKTLAWADSATDDPKNNGLSPFGKEVVREMNRLGMLVDLSHVSIQCMKDALEITQAPVIFSHSSARAICDHPRNVPDEVLKLTKENGGVVMVNFYSGFVVPKPILDENKSARGDVNTVCDHIDHIVQIAGIDHVGIGSDYDGVGRLPVGLESVATYPAITSELLNRGYTKKDIHKLLGENVLRALRQAEKVARDLKAERKAATQPIGELKLDVSGSDRTDAIVKCLVDPLPENPTNVTLKDEQGHTFLAQLSRPSIQWGDAGKGKTELTFIANELPAGISSFKIFADGLNPYTGFEWHDDGVAEAELKFSAHGRTRPVFKYMHLPLDESTPETRNNTYKVFHHAYATNGRQLTKGPGGLFPHHRGLFYGFNRISYGNTTADVWHCKNGASQTHEKTLTKTQGPVFGRHVVLIVWRGTDGKPFAHEFREMTAYRVGQSNVIDFCSLLQPVDGPVKLDGDPQHAGFQFRSSQTVAAETKKQTFYIRPDGVGEPGKYRNWAANAKDPVSKNHVNLPWNAMCVSFPKSAISARRASQGNGNSELDQYTISYLDHPQNPKPSRFSERDYGRFGSYFVHELTSEHPLLLKYRIQISNGVSSIEEINRASQNFAEPVSLAD